MKIRRRDAPPSARNARCRIDRKIVQPLGEPYRYGAESWQQAPHGDRHAKSECRSEGRCVPAPKYGPDRAEAPSYIFTLDLSSAYHQIPLRRKSREITAFTVPDLGLFQFKRMPYGLSNAGATFQHVIDRVIGPELEPYAFSYLDDIIIVTRTFENHLIMLERVLARIKEAGLTINREKSAFGRSEVKYLGVLVNRDEFRTDPDKIAPVIQYPEPKNLKQLRRFLRMASWYWKLPRIAPLVNLSLC